jgi:hypothetical protein
MVRPGISQYFLLPVYFSGKTKNYSKMDITVRDTASELLWCTTRLSYFSKIPFETTDSLFVNLPQKAPIYLPTKILFTEKHKDQVETRIESAVPPAIAKAFMANPSDGIWLKTKEGRILLTPSKKAKKRIHALERLITPLS